MFYAIYRNQTSGKVDGFIVDEPDGHPVEFISEAEGHDKLKGHVLYPVIEFIEL
jgi:hypothetical protein